VAGKRIAVEVLIDLRRRLDQLPARSRERRDIMRQAAALYGVSESTLYRQLEKFYRPKALRRADQGIPRTLPEAEMMRYCEVIAALKIRTMNKKGRYISTVRAIEPAMIYMDNGPIARSHVFQSVMTYLGIQVKLHMPDSKDTRRHTARAKGKVERAFRTVKEAHEVLYHLREPKDEAEANERLLAYLKNYNDHPHRSEPHSRMEDWLANLPAGGIREMCSWERFCTFAREPENRKVGIDARISVDGAVYEVHADLAGESVILWWGLFDNELYVEHDTQRYGPYIPINGPIPLHRYRKFKKTKTEKRLEKIEALAKSLVLGGSEDGKHKELAFLTETETNLPSQPFQDPDPFHEIYFTSGIKARLAIADYLGKPLALLTSAQKDWIDALLEETLDKQRVMQSVRVYFKTNQGGSHVT
jgi:hypothetical protein